MTPEELYKKEFGNADSIPKESVMRLFDHFAKVLSMPREKHNETAESILEKHVNESDMNFLFHDQKQMYNEIINALNEALSNAPIKNN